MSMQRRFREKHASKLPGYTGREQSFTLRGPAYPLEGPWVLIDALSGKVQVEGIPSRVDAREMAEVWNADTSRDLVGTSEAAKILKVEKPRIGRWIRLDAEKPQPEGRLRMVTPAAVLASTPIWPRWAINDMERGVPPHLVSSMIEPLAVVGTREAGEDVLDLKRDRIGAWLKEGIMPPPLVRLRAGPLWWRAEIEALRPERERRRRQIREESSAPAGALASA